MQVKVLMAMMQSVIRTFPNVEESMVGHVSIMGLLKVREWA
jgi:hypothetical protein